MTQQISIKDTRDKLADIINQVAFGNDVFIITKFGKPKAMIVPVDTTEQRKNTLDEVFGLWKDRKDIKNTAEWVRKLRTRMSLRKRDE